MTDVIEHGASRAAGYAIVAALAVIAWWRSRETEGSWSSFWVFTGGVLGAMAMARFADIGGIVTDLGRERVRGAGWYEWRRLLQVLVLLGGAAIGAVGAAFVIARAPQRRSRFLPVAMAVTALVAFAMVRLLSLHHVETVIHGRQVVGVRVGTALEYALVLLAAIAVASHLRGDASDARS